MRVRKNATCHPDKPHVAKGLCQPCYSKFWANEHKVKSVKIPSFAECHPDRLGVRYGKCADCLRAERNVRRQILKGLGR